MRVFSLSRDGDDFLGFDHTGSIIDLTRAISLYEVVVQNNLRPPLRYIEEMIQENILTAEYIGNVIAQIDKYGLRDEFAVPSGYSINAPLYPGKIIALGQNYAEHVKEFNHQIPEEPVLFGKWPSNVIGPEEAIVKPDGVEQMDYEAELAVIIGKDARDVSAGDAMEYVLGYTCFNDVTARSVQMQHMAKSLPWMQSKNYETFAPMGPCILLRDAVSEPVSLTVQTKVNGELRQNGNTNDFIFDISKMIEYISTVMTLEAGDVVTTGTPYGVGPIEPGDVVEVICENIGTLKNPVAAKSR